MALEDAVCLLDQIGTETGIDLQAACRVAACYETLLQRQLPGAISKLADLTSGDAKEAGNRLDASCRQDTGAGDGRSKEPTG